MNKDWTGNSQSTMKNLGASNHTENDRGDMDYYGTEPKAIRLLFELENFSDLVWECSCGELSLSREMERLGKVVFNTDIKERSVKIDKVLDFIGIENDIDWNGDIITNPPYKYANDFILKGLSILKNGNKLALFLPTRYLEGKARKEIYRLHPPKTVYVSSGRIVCAINGEFDKQIGSAVSYCWIVWEKGYRGETVLKWFN